MEMLFFSIVDRGKADAVLNKAKEFGATSGMILLGSGAIQSKLMEKLGITESQKDILIISGTEKLCDDLHKNVIEDLQFFKRNKGIAFTIPFRRWQLNTSGVKDELNKRINPEYFCIITIVDKGFSRKCINSARMAGARGGTIIHGRGAGVSEEFYFPLVIEPQKDIVIIITAKDKVTAIRERITSDLEIKKAGNGILFTLPVTKTSGLFENKFEERRAVKT